jgi:hypothetical protein
MSLALMIRVVPSRSVCTTARSRPCSLMPKKHESFFPFRVPRIGNRHRQRIAERRRSLRERNAVLLQVAIGPVGVPLEVHRLVLVSVDVVALLLRRTPVRLTTWRSAAKNRGSEATEVIVHLQRLVGQRRRCVHCLFHRSTSFSICWNLSISAGLANCFDRASHSVFFASGVPRRYRPRAAPSSSRWVAKLWRRV